MIQTDKTMKVKELIQKLKSVNPDKDVYIPNNDGEHEYYIAHTVVDKTLTVLDEDEDVVVIDFE